MWNQWNKNVFSQILIDFIRTAFPDFHNEIELLITEENLSFTKLKYSETNKGKVFGIEPINRKIKIWVLGDIYGLIKQLK